MNEFTIISNNELNLRKEEIVLTGTDAEELIESKVFVKFLQKSKLSYQIELSKGTHRGREEILYNKMEACDELIKGIESIEKAFKEYNKKDT